MNSLTAWVRVIRVRLLTSSLVAVTNGLAISWSVFHVFNIAYAVLTYVGVLSLHASVDILNDYFDYKSKIDLMTKGTPFSGGTRVLPEGLLKPHSVYKMGMFFLDRGYANWSFPDNSDWPSCRSNTVVCRYLRHISTQPKSSVQGLVRFFS